MTEKNDVLKPLSDEICDRCSKPIDVQPGETFTASTDGRVWHYGCAPSRSRPTASADVVERLEAVARLIERRAADGDDSVLMDEDAADQLAADIRAALSASPVQELVERCKTNLERVVIRKPAGEYARGWNCGIEEALALIDTLAKVRDQ